MTIRIFSIAYDTERDGTGVWLFGSEADRDETLIEIMETVLGDESEANQEDRNQLKESVDNGEITEAWELWEDKFRGHLDTYSLEESLVEIPTDSHGRPILGHLDS